MNSIEITKNRNSKAQSWWMWIVRFIGFLMCIIPLIEPIFICLTVGIEAVQFTKIRAGIIIVGFVMCTNGKYIGTVSNNTGLFIKQILKNLIS